MSKLLVQNVTKSFKKRMILDNVSFHCSSGEIIGVFGKNGSGKSTLLKCIFGSIKADQIQLSIDQNRINPKNIIRKGLVGYLPQDSFLPVEKKVRDIIPLLFPNGDDQDKIFYSKGIYDIEKTKIGHLSLGELRYFEVVLLAHLNHPFLMLDEPFSMIQPLYKDLIKELLLSIKSKKGIIVTDHYYQDVLDITERNIFIKDGKTQKIENSEDLKSVGYLRS